MLAGRVSYVANAISITRQSEREHLPIDAKIMISQALKGPVRRIAAEHVMDCYIIWDFAENKDGAQQFLIDYIDAFHDGFIAGQFYISRASPAPFQTSSRKSPMIRGQIPGQIQSPRQRPRLATNVGFPGYGTAAIDEAFKAWIIPTMFAKVARATKLRRMPPSLPKTNTSASLQMEMTGRGPMAVVETRDLTKVFKEGQLEPSTT